MTPSEQITSPEQRQIDWTSAEIKDGVLTVELDGESPRGWAKRFEAVLALLDHGLGDWGKITVTKQRIKVLDVREGAERDLRHLLESVLLQVNSDLAPDAEEGEESEDSDPQAEADRKMTDTFRGFAPQS
ncbi:MAG TPA: hypothetical protein VGF95_00335 [Solirubrobacteraceae bacterium]|jgi:hypothetical protein